MKPIPLTRMNHLSHIAGTLETLGIAPERILSRKRVPMWLEGDPEDLIPLHDVMCLMQAGSRAAGSATFGLRVGESNSLKNFATVGRLISQSLTTYHALQTVCRLVRLQTSVSRFWLAEAGNGIWLCRGQLEGFDVGLQQMEQYTLMEMIRVLRLGAGSEWQPLEIRVCAPDAPRLEETETLQHARILYEQPFTAVAVPSSILSRPIRRNTPPDIPDLHALEQRRRSRAAADDFTGSLRQVVESHLHLGQLDVHSAAEISGLHERTLQRRLSKDGLTYRQLVDQARFQAGTRLLADPNVKVTDIAYDLGYSDVAHFSRAFRRLVGVSPRRYRYHLSAS